MTRLTAALMIASFGLAGCGNGSFSDSGWNPTGWFSSSSGPQTLVPEGGYAQASDERPGIPQILSARWEPLNEGLLLVAIGFGPTKGYHSAALVTARPQPSGRLQPDPDGVLRLRFVAVPPAPQTVAARLPANPEVDTIKTALAISSTQLGPIARVEIAGASNIVTLGR